MSHSKKQESVTPYTGKKKKGGNIKIKNLYIKEHCRTSNRCCRELLSVGKKNNLRIQCQKFCECDSSVREKEKHRNRSV